MKRQVRHFSQSIGMSLKNLVKVQEQKMSFKVMEAVGGVALKLALEEKEGPFGFNKKDD